jgi:serine carboxypeptidase 1
VRPDALQRLFTNHLSAYLGDPLDALMNGPIRKKLGVIPANVTWGGQSGAVFAALSLDFMKPVWADVDAALALNGAFNVTVEEGQLDLICSAWGADLWMARLQWPGMPSYYAAPRAPRYPSDADAQNHATSGFIKRAPAPYAHFARYDVLSAGHVSLGLGARARHAPSAAPTQRAPKPPLHHPFPPIRRWSRLTTARARWKWCGSSRG